MPAGVIVYNSSSPTPADNSGVLAAVAENAVATTLVTSEGNTLTEIKLTMKNQARSHF